MPDLQPAKLIRLLLNSDDRHNNKPLYEAIVNRCRDLGIAGASVFQGMEGFGESAQIVHHSMFATAQPVVVSVIEKSEVAAALLPELRRLAPNCLIAISDVEMIRIQNGQPTRTEP